MWDISAAPCTKYRWIPVDPSMLQHLFYFYLGCAQSKVKTLAGKELKIKINEWMPKQKRNEVRIFLLIII